MITKNDNIKTKIINYGCNAEGVAKVDGQVVFLPYTLIDEEVTAVAINDKSKFVICKATDINKISVHRVIPPCKYFGKCGGCQLQHAQYEHTLNIKQQIVQDAITGIGKLDFKVLPCVASEKIYGYRNKVALPINPETKKLGMYRTGSHKIVDIDTCLLQSENINKLICVFNSYLQTTKNTIYNENTKRGLLKSVVARELDGNLLVTIVINGNNLPDKHNLIDMLSKNFNCFGLNININKLNNNVILSDKFEHVWGLQSIKLCENDINYEINNQSFLQINEQIKGKLYKKVFEQISGEIVIDAYSGAGLLSALMSKHAQFVYGIEIVKPATELANKLMQANNITNMQNINGDCSVELPKLLQTLEQKEKVTIVIDPPRKGCSKQVLNAILNCNPQKIIYISCDPSTLARDLQILYASSKYKIITIQPYDMFPQTKHVETLTILEKCN